MPKQRPGLGAPWIKEVGLSLLIWASMFQLMMFNVCCGEFSSIGSIVRDSVGQFTCLLLRDLVEKKKPVDILKYVLSISRTKLKE